ncbi:MAG TPA: phosphatase PAP2-related protein [Terriglobia bacterium]|nr:phosphatase PAP2-related protein [Terriglobia bacterium]
MDASARATPAGTRACLARLILAGLGIGGWFWTQALIGRRPAPPSGIGDRLHQVSAPLNLYLLHHATAANALLIVSSEIVDLLALFVFVQWLFGPSVRPLLGLVILLGLRQVVQELCVLPIPPDIVWHYPGFPSLLVTYGISNDFFFSAHTGIAVFAATEIARLRRPWLTALAIAAVVFVAAAVLVLRAHYTMDVFTAIITALYVASVAERLSPWFDRRLARLFATAAR